MKPANKKEGGRLGRARGKKFELKVRHYLESRGYIVCKWGNIVDLENKKLIQAKTKYNPFTKSSSQGNGFPDFIAYKKNKDSFDIVGVESKLRKYLSPMEKKMCEWLIENNIFTALIVAYQDDKCVNNVGNEKHIDFMNMRNGFDGYCEICEAIENLESVYD